MAITAMSLIEQIKNKLFNREEENYNKTHTRLIIDDDVSFAFKEAYNRLAVNLIYSIDPKANNKIAITSTEPNSGKTSAVLNLAIALSKLNKKVLIIECDLRKPAIGAYVNTYKERTVDENLGLTDIIYNNKSIKEVIVENFVENLDILPVGMIPPNPQTVLSSESFKELIYQISIGYDWTIIDTAPLRLVSDTIFINELVDNTLLVINKHLDRKKYILRAKESLGDKLLGAIYVSRDRKNNKKSKHLNEYYYTKKEMEDRNIKGITAQPETEKKDSNVKTKKSK